MVEAKYMLLLFWSSLNIGPPRLAAGSGSTHGFLGWAGFLGRVGSKTPTQSTGLGPGGQPMGVGWVKKFDPTHEAKPK